MRKRTLGVVLLAGLAMSGAGAFTASNTFEAGEADRFAGYGQATASGLAITDIDYNLSSDLDQLESVDFTTSTNATASVVKLVLKSGTTQVGSAYTCTATSPYLLGSMAYLCTVDTDGVAPGNQAIDLSEFDTVGISAATAN